MTSTRKNRSTARKNVCLRIDQAAIALLDTLAAEEGCSRSRAGADILSEALWALTAPSNRPARDYQQKEMEKT